VVLAQGVHARCWLGGARGKPFQNEGLGQRAGPKGWATVGPPSFLIHRSAWKGDSQKVAISGSSFKPRSYVSGLLM
jgi:hypothetical protein